MAGQHTTVPSSPSCGSSSSALRSLRSLFLTLLFLNAAILPLYTASAQLSPPPPKRRSPP
eukprot:CAMPEP_0202868430 /NCGR_PEP_ID=MMETSP1391-20130828/10876_1 /ASSEMBLY_ACC=CAM_ASM_000867 /TAXON_ID=1034604 /ORGANISM="Chlamydomonas leiostraca, Strain SAG 11-49" /LENGTH=59 /DNA_ID=CAMNT_0049548603 /DNA_START=360 /DNA_END=536 /DNA_ORIENTATION=+